jgi:hypothetical protein
MHNTKQCTCLQHVVGPNVMQRRYHVACTRRFTSQMVWQEQHTRGLHFGRDAAHTCPPLHQSFLLHKVCCVYYSFSTCTALLPDIKHTSCHETAQTASHLSRHTHHKHRITKNQAATRCRSHHQLHPLQIPLLSRGSSSPPAAAYSMHASKTNCLLNRNHPLASLPTCWPSDAGPQPCWPSDAEPHTTTVPRPHPSTCRPPARAAAWPVSCQWPALPAAP